MRRILGIGLIVALLAVGMMMLAGCGGSSGTSGTGGNGGSQDGSGSTATAATVYIRNLAFSVPRAEVTSRLLLTWTNEDTTVHTVVGDGGIDSGELAQGQSYTKTFDKAGTYAHNCSIHPSMTGEVVVKQ